MLKNFRKFGRVFRNLISMKFLEFTISSVKYFKVSLKIGNKTYREWFRSQKNFVV